MYEWSLLVRDTVFELKAQTMTNNSHAIEIPFSIMHQKQESSANCKYRTCFNVKKKDFFLTIYNIGVNLWPGGQIWPARSIHLAHEATHSHCASWPLVFYSATHNDSRIPMMLYWDFGASIRAGWSLKDCIFNYIIRSWKTVTVKVQIGRLQIKT